MVLGLNLAGLVLQLGGSVVAALGLLAIWREAAGPGDRFLASVTLPVSRTRRRLTAAALGWLRRRGWVRTPPPRVAQGRGTADVAFSTDSARASAGHAPLADDLSDADKIAVLDQRTRAIAEWVGRTDSQLFARLEAQGPRHTELQQRIDRDAAEQAAQARKRDKRDARRGVWGLIAVGVGTLLQLVALLIPLFPAGDAGRPHQLCALVGSSFNDGSVELAGAHFRGEGEPLCPGEPQDRTAWIFAIANGGAAG